MTGLIPRPLFGRPQADRKGVVNRKDTKQVRVNVRAHRTLRVAAARLEQPMNAVASKAIELGCECLGPSSVSGSDETSQLQG